MRFEITTVYEWSGDAHNPTIPDLRDIIQALESDGHKNLHVKIEVFTATVEDSQTLTIS